MGYTFSEHVTATPFGPVQAHDACGTGSEHFCANDMSLMTIGVSFSETGATLFVARMLGTVYYYRVQQDASGLQYDGPHELLALDAFSREDGLRSFGHLLRQGKLQKVKTPRLVVRRVVPRVLLRRELPRREDDR